MTGAATPHRALPPPPAVVPMTQVFCQVGARVCLGPGPHGERCFVPLGGDEEDWQINRADAALDAYRIT